MNFVFEDLENSRNFVENWGINKAGSDRFTVAPLYNRMVCLRGMNEAHKFTFQEFTIKNKPDKYIIPV